jgi:hypothetical protein
MSRARPGAFSGAREIPASATSQTRNQGDLTPTTTPGNNESVGAAFLIGELMIEWLGDRICFARFSIPRPPADNLGQEVPAAWATATSKFSPRQTSSLRRLQVKTMRCGELMPSEAISAT